MKNGTHNELQPLLNALQRLPCWYVSCGGCTLPTFEVAFGKQVPRSTPLTNLAQAPVFREHTGELNLLVWCSWRLDGADAPLTSSDDTAQAIEQGLARLVGASVVSVELVPPSWDLAIHFTNDLCLHVFCDHVPGDPSFDGNWDLFGHNFSVSVGPGANCEINWKKTETLAGVSG